MTMRSAVLTTRRKGGVIGCLAQALFIAFALAVAVLTRAHIGAYDYDGPSDGALNGGAVVSAHIDLPRLAQGNEVPTKARPHLVEAQGATHEALASRQVTSVPSAGTTLVTMATTAPAARLLDASALVVWATRSGVTRGSTASPIPGVVAAEAGPGGIEPVLQGQAGEAAVRGSYGIGDKATAVIDGRTRIFDGLTSDAVSEVKNVASQSYTQQLRDSVSYAQSNGLRFDLYVRPDTYLTGPLRQAVSDGFVNPRFIP